MNASWNWHDLPFTVLTILVIGGFMWMVVYLGEKDRMISESEAALEKEKEKEISEKVDSEPIGQLIHDANASYGSDSKPGPGQPQ